VVATVKEREAVGWSFEAADASLELLMRAALAGDVTPVAPFALESYRVITEHRADGEIVAEATVKVLVGGTRVIATEEGNGPVNALDAALRSALAPHVPWLDDIELSDYKVRILTPGDGTRAVTRVMIESAADSDHWSTVGVSTNIIDASFNALNDSLIYKLFRDGAKPV